MGDGSKDTRATGSHPYGEVVGGSVDYGTVVPSSIFDTSPPTEGEDDEEQEQDPGPAGTPTGVPPTTTTTTTTSTSTLRERLLTVMLSTPHETFSVLVEKAPHRNLQSPDASPLLSWASIRTPTRRVVVQRFICAFVCLLILIAGWVSLGELSRSGILLGYDQPLFTTCLYQTLPIVNLFTFFIWWHARGKKKTELKGQFKFPRYLLTALVGSCVLDTFTYLWYYSLSKVTISVADSVAGTAPVLVYILSVIFLKERIIITKLIAVVLTVAGVLTVALTVVVPSMVDSTAVGYILVFVDLILWSGFLIFYEKWGTDRSLEWDSSVERTLMYALLYVGLIGLYSLALWIAVPILNATGTENFLLPTWKQFLQLLLNAFIASTCLTVMVVGVACSSALFISLIALLSTPITLLIDAVVNDYKFPGWSYFGLVLMFLGTTVLFADQFHAVWLFYKNAPNQP
ncbi:hypothetical protein Pelo_8770 [Pelomyxa schiedti]|nr:hypothetical protein Pelo_8770 [Pelomyxa schiedti]